MEGKKIIIISPDAWSFVPVSKHHYAKTLAKNNTVYFVNTPSVKEDEKIDGVYVLNKYRKIKGISKIKSRYIKRLMMKVEVSSILETTGGEIDIVWSFDTSRLYFLDLFKAKSSIAHVMDFTEDFNFRFLISSADYCISVADCILDKMREYNQNVYKIDHGFMLGNVNEYIEENDELPPVGVYVGNLNMPFIDWFSLLNLAKAFPKTVFNFYGPLDEKVAQDNKYIQEISDCDNVFFKGFLKPELLNNELRRSTFCLVCYLFKDFGRQLDNSHKIMQYLGSGTPVFSSYTYEYRNTDLLYMYDDEKNIVEAFRDFSKESSIYFSEEHKQKRLEYAMSNSYENQIVKIGNILKQ